MKGELVMATILPVLPLRDIVVFPRMVAPLFVGRDKSVRALEEVEKGGGERVTLAARLQLRPIFTAAPPGCL